MRSTPCRVMVAAAVTCKTCTQHTAHTLTADRTAFKAAARQSMLPCASYARSTSCLRCIMYMHVHIIMHVMLPVIAACLLTLCACKPCMPVVLYMLQPKQSMRTSPPTLGASPLTSSTGTEAAGDRDAAPAATAAVEAAAAATAVAADPVLVAEPGWRGTTRQYNTGSDRMKSNKTACTSHAGAPRRK